MVVIDNKSSRQIERMGQYPIAHADVLILDLVERTSDGDTFVTWNVRHFRSTTTLPVLTTVEYLAG